MENLTFQIAPRPLEVPAALLALDPATFVSALRHWFDFAIEETTNAGQLKAEIEQRIKDQAAGLFSIDEAACIAADAIGLERADRQQVRQAIWRAIDDGAVVPLWDKARTPLPLPLKGTHKSLALVRANELANLFKAWPSDAATPVPAIGHNAEQRKAASDCSARRRTWRDVAWNYMVVVFNAGQFTTAKSFYRELEKKAGASTPFDAGEGANRGSLFVRDISEKLSLKTVQNAWAELKEGSLKAQPIPANPPVPSGQTGNAGNK